MEKRAKSFNILSNEYQDMPRELKDILHKMRHKTLENNGYNEMVEAAIFARPFISYLNNFLNKIDKRKLFIIIKLILKI